MTGTVPQGVPAVSGRFRWFAAAAIGCIAITRILFRSHLLYDLDSVNFALGMRQFDPAAHQPHPPGYFLYVLLARFVSRALPDANMALVAISVATSCGTGLMIYLLAREWFGRGVANTSLVLFLFSPLGWFHGTVALTYMVEAFFSALLGLLCWRVCSGRAVYMLPAAIVFALAAGFRPSTALLLLPLVLWGGLHAPGQTRWLSLLAMSAGMLAWFVPMTVASGGLGSYFKALQHLWLSVPGKRTILDSGWLAVCRSLTIVWIFVLCFGAAAIFALWHRGAPIKGPVGWRKFAAIWVTPGLLFFTFVFLNYINSGYLLVLAPPAFVWLGARVQAFRAQPQPLGRALLACCMAVNCVGFLGAPFYWSYRSIRRFEIDLSFRSRELRRRFDPATTLIIGFDSHFLGYRHAGYSLPEFWTAQYPEVLYPEGPRVFLMKERGTTLVSALPRQGLERFVIFPLPEGPAYSSYLAGVLDKLPAGVATKIDMAGTTVWSGPVSALPLLFPVAGR